MLKSGCATLTREAAMRTRLAGLVLLGMTLVSAGVAVGGDAKAEMKKFEGTWAVELAVEGGAAVPAGKIKDATVTFSGDKVTVRAASGKAIEGTFKIDPGQKPRHIDLALKGKAITGIYAFEGGKLKLCTSKEGSRPTEFRSPEGSKASFMVLKRVKK
jgi:uncharacterized protein (TIGR03067 family)